jgi:bis(5'-nucleosyl)-tetraphosphatase (symmetrical)
MSKVLAVADYAIGDVQGCYEQLIKLLDSINFAPHDDRLWFVGDLINRGPQSLEVLRFVKSLPLETIVTLGNHDLHLLARAFLNDTVKPHKDNIDDILTADDCMQLCHWLRAQKILHFDESLNIVMTHAGIAPCWDLEKAMNLAVELETVLHGENYLEFFKNMYGDEPDYWSDNLSNHQRLRAITNYFTRMRFCYADGRLDFSYKGILANAPDNLIPWFKVAKRKPLSFDLVFGHWAALQGKLCEPSIFAIDTGCVWGGALTALRLQDKQTFSVPGWGKS